MSKWLDVYGERLAIVGNNAAWAAVTCAVAILAIIVIFRSNGTLTNESRDAATGAILVGSAVLAHRFYYNAAIFIGITDPTLVPAFFDHREYLVVLVAMIAIGVWIGVRRLAAPLFGSVRNFTIAYLGWIAFNVAAWCTAFVATTMTNGAG